MAISYVNTREGSEEKEISLTQVVKLPKGIYRIGDNFFTEKDLSAKVYTSFLRNPEIQLQIQGPLGGAN